jgi:hypothetical protein
MGTLHCIKPGMAMIQQGDLHLVEKLDDETVDIIMNSTHDLIQKRLCREVLELRMKLNGFLDIPEEPERA